MCSRGTLINRSVLALLLFSSFHSLVVSWSLSGPIQKRIKAQRRTFLFASKVPTDDTSSQSLPRIPSGVTLKIALDANGGAADLSAEKSERFTCGESLDMVHRLRCVSDAVLIGRGTVVVDNPSLTIRRVLCKCRPGSTAEYQPLRVVLDPNLSLILEDSDNAEQKGFKEYALFTDGLPTVVYHGMDDVDDSLLDLDESVTIVKMGEMLEDDNSMKCSLPIADLLHDLSKRFDVKHLMVEGGPSTARRFLEAQLIDRCIIVKAPITFKEPLDAGLSHSLLKDIAGLKFLGSRTCGVDEIEYWAKPGVPWPADELFEWP